MVLHKYGFHAYSNQTGDQCLSIYHCREDTYAVVPAVVSIPEAWTLPMSSPSDRTVSINDQEDAHVTRVKDANSDSLPTQDEPVGGLCSLHLFAVYDGHGGKAL